MKMSIRDEVFQTLGIEIEEKAGINLDTSIMSKNSSDHTAYGFALTSVYIGFDPSDALIERYGQERADEIMESIESNMDFEMELQRNILYIACVWAAGAKTKVEHLGPKPRKQAERLIDEIAKICVRYWTLEPIVWQGRLGHIGLKQRQASVVLACLEKAGVLTKIKQGGSFGGKRTSNVYKIVGTEDFSPEQINEAFEALNLKSDTAQGQIKEYISVGITNDPRAEQTGEQMDHESKPRKERTADNPNGYNW